MCRSSSAGCHWDCPLAADPGGLDSQARELVRHSSRLSVAVGLLVAKHMPGHSGELSCAGHDRYIPVLPLGEPAEERAERTRVPVEMLSGLNQQPASVGVALFGDPTVVAVLTGLPSRRRQAERRGGAVGVGKAMGITPCGKHAEGDDDIGAGQRHQQAHLLMPMRQRLDREMERRSLSPRSSREFSVS